MKFRRGTQDVSASYVPFYCGGSSRGGAYATARKNTRDTDYRSSTSEKALTFRVTIDAKPGPSKNRLTVRLDRGSIPNRTGPREQSRRRRHVPSSEPALVFYAGKIIEIAVLNLVKVEWQRR